MQRRRAFVAAAGVLLGCTAMTAPAYAQAADAAPAEEPSEEIVVTGSLGALPIANVGSVFGFDKTIVETPRSASTISSEQIERFGITDIYDLVAQAPGTFTNSFFGVGGARETRQAQAEHQPATGGEPGLQQQAARGHLVWHRGLPHAVALWMAARMRT